MVGSVCLGVLICLCREWTWKNCILTLHSVHLDLNILSYQFLIDKKNDSDNLDVVVLLLSGKIKNCGCFCEILLNPINPSKHLVFILFLFGSKAFIFSVLACLMFIPVYMKNLWRYVHVQVVFFTNSGTEANELAMMIARLYTGCNDIISLRNAYHGNAAGTMGATAQCNWKFNVVQVIFSTSLYFTTLLQFVISF